MLPVKARALFEILEKDSAYIPKSYLKPDEMFQKNQRRYVRLKG